MDGIAKQNQTGYHTIPSFKVSQDPEAQPAEAAVPVAGAAGVAAGAAGAAAVGVSPTLSAMEATC